MSNKKNDTIIVNVKKKELIKRGYTDFEDWKANPDNVYIGRYVRYVEGTFQSKWHNPFSVKKYGREKCLKMYKQYLLNNKSLMNDIKELEHKKLGCWCYPLKCHGDIIIEILKNK